jgi:hypothetical protein
MDNPEDIIKKLDNNIEKEIKAIKEGNWKLVDKIINDNNKWIGKLSSIKIKSDKEKQLIQNIVKKVIEIREILNNEIENIQKKISFIQNTSSNLDNLFTKTDQPSYFIDENK